LLVGFLLFIIYWLFSLLFQVALFQIPPLLSEWEDSSIYWLDGKVVIF